MRCLFMGMCVCVWKDIFLPLHKNLKSVYKRIYFIIIYTLLHSSTEISIYSHTNLCSLTNTCLPAYNCFFVCRNGPLSILEFLCSCVSLNLTIPVETNTRSRLWQLFPITTETVGAFVFARVRVSYAHACVYLKFPVMTERGSYNVY